MKKETKRMAKLEGNFKKITKHDLKFTHYINDNGDIYREMEDDNGEIYYVKHSGHIDRNGYLIYRMQGNDKKLKQYLIHRLVAFYFLDNYDDKLTVNHLDFDKLNNNISNLEMCTHSDNIKHTRLNNPYYSCRRYFTTYEVKSMRSKFNNGTKIVELANEYSITPMNMANIIKRKTYTKII